MAYFLAIRTQRDIDANRAGTFHGTQFGAAWPTVEAALRSRPHYAVEAVVVSARDIGAWAKKVYVVAEEDVDAEIAKLVALGHIAA